jgi:acyl carrier protein
VTGIPPEAPRGAATIGDRVRRIVAETQRVPADAVCPDAALEADLGVDSLAMIEITVAVEEELGIRSPDVDELGALAIVTVRDLADFVAAELDRQSQVPG